MRSPTGNKSQVRSAECGVRSAVLHSEFRIPNSAFGFTFVELLITLALLTLVVGTIAATLSGGLSIWQRTQTIGTQDQALQVAAVQLQRDAHGVRRFAPMPFEGAYDEVSFPAMVPAADEPMLGRVGYFFDSGRRRLCRSSVEVRDVRLRRLREACQPLLTEVDRARFAYYGWDEASAGYGWTSEWSAPTMPLAMKIELGWRVTPNAPLTNQTMLVRIPIAATDAKHQ